MLFFAILLVAVSIPMYIMNIWIPDIRWAQTGGILMCCGIVVAVGAAAVKDFG